MVMDLSVSYMLGCDIDVSEIDGSNVSGMWIFSGFLLVGNGIVYFSGSFDGVGYMINDFSIN